jgi:hypothetical protein
LFESWDSGDFGEFIEIFEFVSIFGCFGEFFVVRKFFVCCRVFAGRKFCVFWGISEDFIRLNLQSYVSFKRRYKLYRSFRVLSVNLGEN